MGKLLIPYDAGEFLLTARADRIDLFSGPEAEIIDYKTGHIPTDIEIKGGFAPQLPLEGAILLGGGFSVVPTACCLKNLSYWGLYGRNQDWIRIIAITLTFRASLPGGKGKE